jgi:hypothetical protein
MVEHRWLRAIGPGVVALGAMVAIGSATGAARERPWMPLACGGGDAARVVAAREGDSSTTSGPGIGAWMRLDPTLDPDGALLGQRLSMGIAEGTGTRVMELPAESFAAGPFGRLLLVGADDGAASRLFTIDVATGCTSAIAQEQDVVRRATIDPAGETVFETRVDRTTRADLGVWRRPLDASRPAAPLLDPLPADSRFGRTWSTEFAWSLEGDRLAVQSCGGAACRTRVLDPAPGGRPVRLVADPELGPLVGLAGDRLVTYDACRGLPCPIESVDVDSGDRTLLSDEAGLAVLSGAGPDARLVHETSGASGPRLRSIAPDGRIVTDLGAVPTGLRLMPDATRSGSGTRLPRDWVALAPDGRLPIDAPAASPELTLRHVPDGLTVPLPEVTR